MKFISLVIFCLSIFGAVAQDTVRMQKRSVTKKSYESNRVVLIVEGFKTTERAFGLFKPEQITMRDERPMSERGDTLVLTIHVKDKNHPAIYYFKSKARILYQDKFYDHGNIPEINPAHVSEVEYHSFPDGQEDYLEVKLYGEEYRPSKPSMFRAEVETRTTNYFDLDGTLYTAEEFRKIIFKPGEVISKGMISGKEAIEMYGDKKYAEGVARFTRKK